MRGTDGRCPRGPCSSLPGWEAAGLAGTAAATGDTEDRPHALRMVKPNGGLVPTSLTLLPAPCWHPPESVTGGLPGPLVLCPAVCSRPWSHVAAPSLGPSDAGPGGGDGKEDGCLLEKLAQHVWWKGFLLVSDLSHRARR